MIKIGKPYVAADGRVARLVANIDVDGQSRPLWIEVDAEYQKFLCSERSDGFVLGLLHYAMKKGHDIVSEAPMTDRLYQQLTEQFMPAFAKANNIKNIHIEAPVAEEVEHPDDGIAVGTGCSCGVDSMHVYAAHKEITHGCVWNVHGVTFEETQEKRNIGWNNLIHQAKRFTAEVGVRLIVCNSNFDRGCSLDLLFDGSISYGNLFFIFALQKLWKRYYVASGYDITEFKLGCGVNADPAHYEYLLFSFCCLKNISVAIDGVAQTRVEKVADLISYPLAKKYLNVCWEINAEGTNCSFGCAKCMRTMLELDALGALDDFSCRFDVAYYRKNFHQYLAEFYRGCLQHNVFALELKPYFQKRRYGLSVYMGAYKIVLIKALKKVFRGWKTNDGKFSQKG